MLFLHSPPDKMPFFIKKLSYVFFVLRGIFCGLFFIIFFYNLGLSKCIRLYIFPEKLKKVSLVNLGRVRLQVTLNILNTDIFYLALSIA